MPRGPRAERRPTDVIGNTVKVMRITTGEKEDERAPIANAAAKLGRLGAKPKLKDDWFRLDVDVASGLEGSGIYQWTIEGVGIYVGRAKVLHERLRAYPKNIQAMLEGRPWHGNPLKEYRAIHTALCEAHDAGVPVVWTVLEFCDAAIRVERKRHWIQVRRNEAEHGGPQLLSSN